jgi:hypothetical protein
VTILMAHRKPCGVDAHFLPLTFKGQLALASLARSGPEPGCCCILLLHQDRKRLVLIRASR